MEVMDGVSDKKDTILELLHRFIKGQDHQDYLVIEGDQKLFEIFQELKHEYGKDLNWVIPMPEDWHMLMNYQKALMKPYSDAGFKELAKASGYPIASIQACGQFERTHHFLMEVWEALFRVMFLKDQTSGKENPSDENPIPPLPDPLIKPLLKRG